MSNLVKLSIWILVATIHQFSRAKSEVTVFPDNLTVFERSNGTVRCTYNGDSSLLGATFKLNDSIVATIVIPRCKFNNVGLDNYTTDCVANKTFTLTMINISRQDHGKHVRCTIFLNNTPPEESLNSALVYVNGAKPEVTIFPETLTAFERSNGTVRCTYHGNNSLLGATFKLNQSIVAVIILPRCKLNTVGLDTYTTDCEGNKTFTLTLINISRHDHGKSVRCTIFLNNTSPENSLNKAFVYVNVPVERVSITTPTVEDEVLSVCENVNIILHCITSAARPAANINWLYQSEFSTGDITAITVNSTTLETEENDLFITSSTLYIIAKRSLNSRSIFCSSGNIPDIVVNSSNITFDILSRVSDSPEQSPTILNANVTNGDTYRIIEGRQGVLTCAVPISNPNATLTWTSLEHSQYMMNSLDFVSNELEWVPSRHEKNVFTCIAKHECNNLTKSISVKVEVLYSPTLKPMKDFSILEGSLLNITCDITLGIPVAVTISWKRQTNILITNSRLLTINNISRDFSSLYTCYVANLMKPTIGIEERGESSSSMYVDVLYPPTVNPIKNQTVTEGSDFNLSCPVNPGNPKTTHITWTSIDRRIQRATQFLSFTNISRKYAAMYKCTAFNIMKPTNNIKAKGNDSESFHLIVEYRATIKQFFINGYNSYSNVTLNEHGNAMFLCNVDGLPTSTTDITFQNGIKLISTNSIENVSYDLGPATCLDAGIYECSARNKHNSMQEAAKKQLFLFVNCHPRAHPNVQVKSNISTALNEPLVLSFTAVAYPLPITVNWQKFNGSNWTIIMLYNDTSIRQSNLIFNLTFLNVQQEDFGKYKLVIINEIDKFEQNFTIIPADKDVYKENQGGSTVGIVVGVVFGNIGAVVAVVLVIWVFRKRKLYGRQKESKDVVYQNDFNIVYRNDTDKHYESLDENQRDTNKYSQLSWNNRQGIIVTHNNDRHAGCEEFDTNTRLPIYANLKLK